MDVRFPLPDGFVDLDARLVVRAGSRARLSGLDVRILTVLHAHERRAVSLDALAHELWGSGSDDGIAALEIVLGQLEQTLEAQGGPKVLRSMPGLGVGLWPAKGEVVVDGEQGVVLLVHAAGELAQREDPEGAAAAWVACEAALVAGIRDAGLDRLATSGRVFAAAGPLEAVLDWGTAGAVAHGLAGGATLARWARGGRGGAVDEAVRRGLSMASAAGACTVLLDGRAMRRVRDTPAYVRRGRLHLDDPCVAQPVWSARGTTPPLLPGRPRPSGSDMGPVFGRDDDVRAVVAALDGGVGLVVIHGPSGAGTTTVALEVARECERARRGFGSVVVIRLPDGSHERALAAVVAADLGLSHAASGREGVGRALAALGDVVLVLDGFDQLSDADAATLSRWRAVAPACRFVVTARRPSRVPGGVLVRVDGLGDAAARDMLRHRTRGIPAWGDVDDSVLDEIIRCIGAAPLSIVLTAGRARTQRPERLAKRLGNEVGEGRTPTVSAALSAALARLPGPLGFALERVALIPGPFEVGEVVVVVEDLELEAVEAIAPLLDAGLLQRIDDHEGIEPRFRMVHSVRELATRGASATLAGELEQRRLAWVGQRAGVLVRALFRSGQDHWALRHLTLRSTDLSRAAAGLVDIEPELAAAAVRASFVVWRLDRTSTEALADCAAAVGTAGRTGGTLALMRAELALARNQRAEALSLLESALSGPPAVADMARVLALGSSRGPGEADRRRRLADVVHRALEDVGPQWLGWVWDLVQVVSKRGMHGDAAELAGRYIAVAAEVGSDMLQAALTRLAWRARCALGRARPEEWHDVANALRALSHLGAHPGASEGLQDLARHMTAVGQPDLALATLDRVRIYVEAFGSPTVRRSMHVDRARALAQLGRHDEATAALDRYAELGPPDAARPLASMDQTLLALARLDFSGASDALEAVEADDGTSATGRRWCALIRAVVDLGQEDLVAAHGRIEAVRPLWPAEIVMRELVQAWIDEGQPPAPGIARAEAHVEARSVGMAGVVLRTTLATARQLAEPTSGQ